MASAVGASVAHVDGVLAAGEALFPDSGSTGHVGAGGGPAVAAPPPGAQLSSGAGGAGDDYQRRWDGLGELDDHTNRAADEATARGQQGRAGASALRQSARAQAAALAPATGSPAGVKLLVSAMDEHLDAMQHQIDATKAHNELVAGRLDGLADGYRTTAADRARQRKNTVQAADFTHAPERPPFPLPEKPWEYNLDFTSDVEARSLNYPGVTNAGQVTSIDDAWNELNRCFNCNFPMGGAPSKPPKVGDELPLEIRIAGQQMPVHFPVKVTQMDKTANDINIEFATLPGHVDGVGSTIHFHFFEQGGQLHLGIRGYITDGPGSEDIPVISPGLRSLYTGVALGTWQPYIDRLTRHVAEAKGLNTYGGR